MDSENSFSLEVHTMMDERSKDHILVVSHEFIVRTTTNHHETHFTKLGTSLSMRSSLEQLLLLTTTMNIYCMLHSIFKSHAQDMFGKMFRIIIESSPNLFTVINAVAYALKATIRIETETKLKGSQD